MEKREATRHDIKSWLNRKKASNPRSDFGYLKSLFFNKVKLSGKQVIKNLPLTTFHLPLDIWGYSSAGRAPALQAGGLRFDPAYLHQIGEFAIFGVRAGTKPGASPAKITTSSNPNTKVLRN